MISLFSPSGPVADAQKDLIIHMVLIMLIVVIPVFILFFVIAWRYREDNPKAKYDPEKKHNPRVEIFLWFIPMAVVATLWVSTWRSAHDLDPYKPIQSANAPITIQVVALPWKWLFIYPAQNIATVNYIEFPENTPVHFELTADGPISSFWIPQLGTQIYAMAAMQTQLYTIASSTGEFVGKDTEINGEGYSRMLFTADSVSQSDFDAWIQQMKGEPTTLDQNGYDKLAEPSMDNPRQYYSSVEEGLFNNVMMKFMAPNSTMPGMKM